MDTDKNINIVKIPSIISILYEKIREGEEQVILDNFSKKDLSILEEKRFIFSICGEKLIVNL